jgi:hypothetical protein
MEAVVTAAAAVVVEAAAVAVLAAMVEGEWGTAVRTLQEWGTAGATVRPAAAGLDSATQASGIRGTTLCQREAPIRKTLRTKAELITAEAFRATATRGNL